MALDPLSARIPSVVTWKIRKVHAQLLYVYEPEVRTPDIACQPRIAFAGYGLKSA